MDKPINIKCSCCQIEKQLIIDFYKNKAYKYGYERICKSCKVTNHRNIRQKNKDEWNQRRREHYLEIKDKIKEWDKNSKANKKKYKSRISG